MTSRKSQIEGPPGIEKLQEKYGDLASEYAKVRAETAEEAGEPSDAAHWQQMEESLESSSPDDNAAAKPEGRE